MEQEPSFSTLMEILTDQLEFLEKSAESYDQGYDGEVFRQAPVIRLLVDDTTYATSVLTKLGRKNIPFMDTRIPPESVPSNAFSELVEIKEIESETVGLPLLDDGPAMKLTDFDTWWKTVVVVDDAGVEFRREDVVNYFTRPPGELKVDSILDETYANLRNKSPLSWPGSQDTSQTSLPENLMFASIRQITHEVIKTIKVDYTRYKDPKKNAAAEEMKNGDLIDMSSLLSKPSGSGQSDSSQKNVGRNDPCPCGSGKKYKKCCMIN